jgi:peptidoglycan/xylan/chitin deacetylase (PgdA/CDA1 family)
MRFLTKRFHLILLTIVPALIILLYPPYWILGLISEVFPGAIYFIDTKRPLVALTIDDGPNQKNTPRILDVLSKHEARATFFLVSSRINGNEKVLRRMVREGHELGNHLSRHNVASISLDNDEFISQFLKTDSILSEFAEVKWFRPGSGWYNQMMIKTIKEYNYRCALGSVYPFDPFIHWEWFLVNYIVLNSKPGAIIILHDGPQKGERTGRVLEKVLPQLNEKGFQVVTLSQLCDENSQ